MKILDPENHKQIRDKVADRLRVMISQGELRGGEWLRQGRLSETLGISYTPIREALKQLEAEGLVEHVPYRGVRVVTFSVNDVLDIYSMRSVLEGLAAGSAATRLTDDQLVELRSLHEQMAALSGPQHLEQVRELNRRFHLLIIEASERRYLVRTLNTIWTWFPTMLWSQFVPPESTAESHRERNDNEEHAALVEALEARDPVASERLMRHHIDQARQALVDYLAQSR